MDSEDTVRTAERKHYTVLWTFDTNTATPLSRTRLNTATTDLASGLAILHAEAGKLSIHPPPMVPSPPPTSHPPLPRPQNARPLARPAR